MIDLRQTRVLVTGGSRGIGAACCRLFAQAGAQVAVHYNSDEKAARTVLEALPAVPGGAHRLAAADLRTKEGIEALTRSVGQQWSSLDCLVNNAGIWTHNPVGSLDSEAFDETWRLNVRAPFLITSALLPMMADGADPNIVNITSTAGQRGEAFYSPYAASKGALISATKSWAAELGPKIRVNSVAPGWVDTDMSAAALEGDGRHQIEAALPLGRVATAEEIAGAVLFLASPLAADVTGEILNVNGGGVLCG